MANLTPKQTRFVAEYLVDLNGKQAAIRAGYAPQGAEACASRLLTYPKVARAVAEGKARQLQNAELSAARVLEELRRLSFSDLAGVFGEHGGLLSLHQMSADVRAAIASVKVTKKNLTAGDGVMEDVVEVKLWDKTRALESLAKHFGLLKENLEHSGEIRVTWQAS